MTRLRVKSARFRVTARTSGSELDTEKPVISTPVLPVQLLSQTTREEAEGEEEKEEEQGAGEGGQTFRRGEGGAADGEGGERIEARQEEEEEEEKTQVEELENDSSFQRADDKEEIF